MKEAVMRRSCCLAVVLSATLGGQATAQQTVVVFGRVLGSDQATAVPPAWTVRVTAEYPGSQFDAARDSEAELFVHPVRTDAAVRIHFQAVGYRRAATDFDTYRADKRVRPDVLLEKITPEMALFKKGTPDDLTLELETEAKLARATGTTEIFDANLSLYRTAAQSRPAYVAEIDAFKTRETYRELKIIGQRDLANPNILEQLVADPSLPMDEGVADDLLKYVRDTTVFPGVRSMVLDYLTRQPLPDDVKPMVTELARELVRDDVGAVRVAGQGALIRLEGPAVSTGPGTVGVTSADRAWTVEALEWANDGDRHAAPARGAGRVRPTGGLDQWVTLAGSASEPSETVTAVRWLAQSGDEAATRALIKAMDASNPTAARLEAAKALAERAPGNRAVTGALESAAKMDASGEVRLVAAGAVKAATAPK
jgi:HEAT repeats